MQGLLTIGLVAFTAWLVYKNVGSYKRMGHNKAYIVCTNAIFDEDEDVLEKIDNFINTHDSIEFQNKAKVLKLYEELKEGKDYTDTLASIDLKTLFYENDKVDLQKVDWNSDTFCWIVAAMIKAHKLNLNEVIETLMQKFEGYPFLENHIEYILCKETSAALLNREDEGFFRRLINGDYVGYKYDGRLIGLYKRIASAILVYKKEELDEFEKEDVYTLAQTKLGKFILEDLDLFEAFDHKEDDTKEDEE